MNNEIALDTRSRLILQLKNHGVANADKLSIDELQARFMEISREWSKKFANFNLGIKQEKSPETIEIADGTIKARIKDSDDFYSAYNELLKSYSYGTIHEVVANTLPAHKIEKALLILEIKYRQYQEIIIEQIAHKIASFMPKEECATFMLFIENHRDEVELLKDIFAQLNDSKIAHSISNIANTKKYIISEFMPRDMEKNYKQFFNNAKDKQELVRRLRGISNAYSKKQIDDMTKEDLIDILNSIRQKELSDKKDAEDFKKYLEAFRLAIYDQDDSRFDALVIQVLEDVSNDCLAKLKLNLRAEDPLFDNKFSAAQREWNKIKKHI